jgi:DNA-directed RNA polymerase subunit RPC12/RpoP
MHYHLKTHEGKLPFECGACNKQFLHASTLDIHKKAHHHVEQERGFKCPGPNCEFKGAFTKANLLIHYVRKHCAVEVAKMLEHLNNKYRCSACKKEMNSLTAFHYHTTKCISGLDDVRTNHINAIQAL